MKILVVDDHPVMREGVSALLRPEGPQTIIVQASSAAEALAAVDRPGDLDIVVLDLMMPGTSGLSTISEIGRARPELPVIVLSSSEDPRDVRHALSKGALGYGPKSASQTTLLSAIRLVMSGELYISPLMLNQVAVAKPVADRPMAGAVLTPARSTCSAVSVKACLTRPSLMKWIFRRKPLRRTSLRSSRPSTSSIVRRRLQRAETLA